MLQSLTFTSSFCTTTLVLETNDQINSARSPSSSRGVMNSTICCSSSSRNNSYIPKLEPFSRTKIERVLKDPPLIEKSGNQLAGTALFLFSFSNTGLLLRFPGKFGSSILMNLIQKEAPMEEVERLIIEAGGIKSLIGYLHGIAEIHKSKEGYYKPEKASNSELKEARTCPIPDGLPKSREELEEEEKARMPDSPFTRLLRTKGTYPAWYSPAPDY